MELDRVEVGGLGIAYRRAGAGPALLLVHGALGDSRDWRPQLEGLAGELTVVAWDAPGCGGSDDPPESFRLPDFADCLAAFAAAIGFERPHVLGLSFGGGLALELYRRHPGLPRSLLLASAYAGWAGSLPPEVVRERVERAEREAGLPPACTRRSRGRGCGSCPGPGTRPTWRSPTGSTPRCASSSARSPRRLGWRPGRWCCCTARWSGWRAGEPCPRPWPAAGWRPWRCRWVATTGRRSPGATWPGPWPGRLRRRPGTGRWCWSATAGPGRCWGRSGPGWRPGADRRAATCSVTPGCPPTGPPGWSCWPPRTHRWQRRSGPSWSGAGGSQPGATPSWRRWSPTRPPGPPWSGRYGRGTWPSSPSRCRRRPAGRTRHAGSCDCRRPTTPGPRRPPPRAGRPPPWTPATSTRWPTPAPSPRPCSGCWPGCSPGGGSGLEAVQSLADPFGDADGVKAQLGQEELALAVGQELVGDAQPQQRGGHLLVGQDLGHGRAEPAGQDVVLDGGDQPVGAGHGPQARVERLDPTGVGQGDADPVLAQQPGRLLAADGQPAKAEQEHVLAAGADIPGAQLELADRPRDGELGRGRLGEADRERPAGVGDRRGQGTAQLGAVAGRGDDQVGDLPQPADVVDAVVGGAVLAGDAGAVEHEDDRQPVQGDVHHHLVEGPLQEGRVDGADRPQPLEGHAGGHGHPDLLGDADVED